jgi:ribosomal protein S3
MDINTIDHWIFLVKRKITFFFYPERNRLSKQAKLNRKVANIIKEYFECDLGDRSVSVSVLGLTRVSVKEKRTIVHITIELYRPGLFIGKAGKTFDEIQNKISNHFDKKVKIHIIESNLF